MSSAVVCQGFRKRRMDQPHEPVFALIAGEISGDLLGGQLIVALRRRYPKARFVGVCGPRMLEAGCEALASIDALSVMGLAEVLPAIPRLLRLRSSLLKQLSALAPTAVIGIDAPDFNLGLERRLRQRGIPAVHLVSPTVWAWRQSRIKGIAKSVDLMLCLFDFETDIYHQHGVDAAYIGHPLADSLRDTPSRDAACAELGLKADQPVLAVLPGSRGGEVKYLAPTFAKTIALLCEQMPQLQCLTPLAKPGLRGALERAMAQYAPEADWRLLEGQSDMAMRAADAVLLASGTATLECLLLRRPMVVAYQGSALTAFVMLKLGLLKSQFVSLPNLLTGQATVPELLQGQATPEALAAACAKLLTDASARDAQTSRFDAVRDTLQRDAATCAAEQIARLIESRR